MTKAFAPCFACCVAVAAFTNVAAAQTAAQPDRFGDVMRWAVPAGAAAFSLARGDTEGLMQLGLSWSASQIATEALKQAVNDPRPSGAGKGFVSGHASGTFAAAGYLHRRYGLAPAVPAYVLATLTAYSRVDKGHHYTRQVVSGAAVGLASGFLLTKPLANGGQVGLAPTGGGVALFYAGRW